MSTDPKRITLRCPECGNKYAAKPKLAGKTVKCDCGTRLLIPTANAEEIEVAPSTPSLLEEALAAIEEATIARTNLRPSSSEDLDVEAAVVSTLPVKEARTLDAEERAFAANRPGRRTKSRARGFVSVYGYIVICVAIVTGIANLFAAYALMIKSEFSPAALIIVPILLIAQSAIAFVIYRLGNGLVYGERSAVHGLLAVYLLATGVASYLFYSAEDRSEYLATFLIVLGACILFFLPPVLVAYTCWNDFDEAEV